MEESVIEDEMAELADVIGKLSHDRIAYLMTYLAQNLWRQKQEAELSHSCSTLPVCLGRVAFSLDEASRYAADVVRIRVAMSKEGD